MDKNFALWSCYLVAPKSTTHGKYYQILSPTDALENCLKRGIKIYIKATPTCFSVIIIIINERTI